MKRALGPYVSDDQSRDNVIFAILGLGEGWHNTHHSLLTSARHGLCWWQFDLSCRIIQALGWIGLAWDIRFPSAEAQVSKRSGEGGPEAPAAS